MTGGGLKISFATDEMKKIGEVLEGMGAEDWAPHRRQAERFRQIEEALRRLLAEDGLGDVVCRAASLDGGALLLAADNPSACARLRQMRDSLLGRLQEQFPDIQELRFGVRP